MIHKDQDEDDKRFKKKTPYQIHLDLMENYKKYKENAHKLVKTYKDAIREEHKFIRDDLDDEENMSSERKAAIEYYNSLYKEFCIADMKRYKEGKIGLRWRVESEVIEGKGQYICGNKRCKETSNLNTLEVNFAYREDNTVKNALVKLRLCPSCTKKLNYKNSKQKRDKDKRKSRK